MRNERTEFFVALNFRYVVLCRWGELVDMKNQR